VALTVIVWELALTEINVKIDEELSAITIVLEDNWISEGSWNVKIRIVEELIFVLYSTMLIFVAAANVVTLLIIVYDWLLMIKLMEEVDVLIG